MRTKEEIEELIRMLNEEYDDCLDAYQNSRGDQDAQDYCMKQAIALAEKVLLPRWVLG